MAKKSLRELKSLIEKEIAYNKDSLKAFEGNENPQVKELYIQTESRITTLENILEYAKTGSKVFFDS